jgi:hypothetical protein
MVRFTYEWDNQDIPLSIFKQVMQDNGIAWKETDDVIHIDNDDVSIMPIMATDDCVLGLTRAENHPSGRVVDAVIANFDIKEIKCYDNVSGMDPWLIWDRENGYAPGMKEQV